MTEVLTLFFKEEKPLIDTAEQETKQKSDDAVKKEAEEDNIFAANRYRLDSCIIKISPPMNQDVEHLTYPENMLSQLMVEAYQNENGLVFSGVYCFLSFLSSIESEPCSLRLCYMGEAVILLYHSQCRTKK